MRLDYLEDATSGVGGRQAESVADPADRPPSQIQVQRQGFAQRCSSGETTYNQIGIGNRRTDPTPAVGSRAGNRAGAAGSDPKSPTRIYPGEAPTSGTDRVDRHRGQSIWKPTDGPFEHDLRPTIGDPTHIGAGPTHVERDQR